MPRTKTTAPKPSREKGQRSLEDPLYLDRVRIPFPMMQPEYVKAPVWRAIVMAQPVCVDAREYLISSILDLDWKIEPVDTTQRDELKTEIDYYTNLIKQHGDMDYESLVEWIGKDFLDLPFGAAIEVGREGDRPDGRVLWYKPIDGATCFPTLNDKWPIGQKVYDRFAYFPSYAINRIYMSPRTEIQKRGWGMPPPEKIYLALEMINRGDQYYANLLLDTPPTGILDLIDMDADSASEWVKAWRKLLGGVDPYKIPVLYEHDRPAEWIDFTRQPTEIMFLQAIGLYQSLVCSGYGISPSDIGLGNKASGGETLSGTIRDERRTRRTGFARFKKKLKSFFDRMLPDTLEFKFIDLDEELSVAMGRARLANATAIGALVDKRVFSPKEMRMQTVADGLVNVPVTEDVPPDSEFPDPMGMGSAERPNMMGRPVQPSAGGQGEVTNNRTAIEKAVDKSFRSLDEVAIRRLMYRVHPIVSEEVRGIREALGDSQDVHRWSVAHEDLVWGNQGEISPESIYSVAVNNILGEFSLPELDFTDIFKIIDETLDDHIDRVHRANVIKGKEIEEQAYWYDEQEVKDRLIHILSKIPEFMAKSVVSATRDYVVRAEANLEPERIIDDGECVRLAKYYINRNLDSITSEVGQELSGIILDIVKGVRNASEESSV